MMSFLLGSQIVMAQTPIGSTYLIITYPDFYQAVQELATYRQSQGERVIVITTEEIYRQFTFESDKAEAIHAFLRQAYHQWTPPPTYVLLVGDASDDPTGLPDLLPAKYLDAPIVGKSPADYEYAKVSGDDDDPDLRIGRIPARTVEEVKIVIDKIKQYEQSPPNEAWKQRVILVAHDQSEEFRQEIESLATFLPITTQAITMYTYSPTVSVADEINQGALLLSYSGHGAKRVWGKWQNEYRIFENDDVDKLTNGYQLPFVTISTCLSGMFSDSAGDKPPTIAERLLFWSNGGAISVWATSALGFPTPNRILHEELYRAMFAKGEMTLGTATLTAMREAKHRHPEMATFFANYNYFGDPALRLGGRRQIAIYLPIVVSQREYGNYLPIIIKP